MNDDQRKHLEFIQATITRMAGNSFLIRGWSVTAVSALFALAAKDANGLFVLVSYFPCILFWSLDAYYLSQERKFRSLYDFVREEKSTDFSMNTNFKKKDADGNDLADDKEIIKIKNRSSWGRCFFSTTVMAVHLTTLGTIIFVMCICKK